MTLTRTPISQSPYCIRPIEAASSIIFFMGNKISLKMPNGSTWADNLVKDF